MTAIVDANAQLLEATYADAVRGMTEATLQDHRRWYEHIASLSPKLRTTYCVFVLQVQVENGGFHQYFANSYGIFARLTVAMLVDIGAAEVANFLQVAMTTLQLDRLTDNELHDLVGNRRYPARFEDADEFGDALAQIDTGYSTTAFLDVWTKLAEWLRAVT